MAYPTNDLGIIKELRMDWGTEKGIKGAGEQLNIRNNWASEQVSKWTCEHVNNWFTIGIVPQKSQLTSYG